MAASTKLTADTTTGFLVYESDGLRGSCNRRRRYSCEAPSSCGPRDAVQLAIPLNREAHSFREFRFVRLSAKLMFQPNVRFLLGSSEPPYRPRQWIERAEAIQALRHGSYVRYVASFPIQRKGPLNIAARLMTSTSLNPRIQRQPLRQHQEHTTYRNTPYNVQRRC